MLVYEGKDNFLAIYGSLHNMEGGGAKLKRQLSLYRVEGAVNVQKLPSHNFGTTSVIFLNQVKFQIFVDAYRNI